MPSESGEAARDAFVRTAGKKMKFYLLGILTPVVIVSLGWSVCRFQQWKTTMDQTFGEHFVELANEEDAVADEWERKLYGDGWSGWAGYDCGRQSDGLYRSMAMTLIKRHRQTAAAIRAELPDQPEYDSNKFQFEQSAERQREWQKWYEDFHKRNNLKPLTSSPLTTSAILTLTSSV
jgi:crotonobetainyl-CoA:carnitine CoA-transferase CaiB-like acyl-CoA transferase